MATNHGPPRKRAFSNIPIQIRLSKNLHGNTGSCVSDFEVTLYSHNKKAIHVAPEVISNTRTKAEFQGYLFPASSSGATRDRVATRSKKAPEKSTLRKDVLDREFRVEDFERSNSCWCGKPFGKQTMISIAARMPAGTMHRISAHYCTRDEMGFSTYLSKNTHRHVVDWLMAPPKIGPSTRDKQ